MADPQNEMPAARIMMWCIPRALSTAFTKCMSGIEGIEVFFETYTLSAMSRDQYRQAFDVDIPMNYEGNEEAFQKAADLMGRALGGKIEPDRIAYGNIKRRLENSTNKFVFAKEMGFAFPDEKTRRYLPEGFRHVFLIRNPYSVFQSLRKAMYTLVSQVGIYTGEEAAFDMERDQTIVKPGGFYSDLCDLYRYVRSHADPETIVLNADDLLANPADVLSRFCERVGLPYSDTLLKWDASTDVVKTWNAVGDDVVINGSAFYQVALGSGGFLPPPELPPKETLSPDVRRLAEAAMPLFREINHHKI